MTEKTYSRRNVVRGAAWSVPVIAAAVAAPLAAASTVNVGAFSLTGTCGVPDILGPGFTLTSSPDTALPVGTSILITATGTADIGTFSYSGSGSAQVSPLSATSRLVVLTSALPAGSSLVLRTTLSISTTFNLNAQADVPDDYVAGAGAKTSASVSSGTILCVAS